MFCHSIIFIFLWFVFLPFYPCLFLCLSASSFVFLKRGNYRLKERGGGGLRSSRVVLPFHHFHLFVVCLFVVLSVCLSIYLSVNMSFCLSVYLSSQMTKNIHYFTIYIYKSICLSAYLSVNLSVCLSVITDDQKYTHNKQEKYIHYYKIHIYTSICLSVCLSVCLSKFALNYP